MKKLIFNYLLIFLSISMFTIDSCKCNKGTETDPCPTCGTNEECINGICDCKPGHKRLWGVCSLDGSEYGEVVYYAESPGCLSYDSTCIIISKYFNTYFTDDTSTGTPIMDCEFRIYKYKNFDKYIWEQGAGITKDSSGNVVLYFTLGNMERCGFGNYDVNNMRAKWRCVFTKDLQSFKAKIKLYKDLDGDWYPETLSDSCEMTYHLL